MQITNIQANGIDRFDKNSKLSQAFTPKDIEGTFDDGTGKFYIHYNGLPIGTADITADVNEGI